MIKPSAIAVQRDTDLYAGVIAKQAQRAAGPFVLTRSNRAPAKYWILLWMLCQQLSTW
jgi:hypothetical protein